MPDPSEALQDAIDAKEASEAQDIAEYFAQLSSDFDELCQTRHEAGQAEYGAFTFLENDIVRMMAEELADTANYCRMQFIKLMILQDALVNKFQAENGEVNIDMGAQAFKGTKTGWKQ